MSLIRVGFVGLGGNCRLRHVPGLRACADVEISGVVNRRTEGHGGLADVDNFRSVALNGVDAQDLVISSLSRPMSSPSSCPRPSSLYHAASAS